MSDSDPPDPPDPPDLDDPPGRLDNWLVYAIAVSPAVILLTTFGAAVVTVVLVVSGNAGISIPITGTVPASVVWRTVVAPFMLFALAAFVFLWIVSMMAWFGAAPIMRIARFLDRLIRDYQGGT